MLSSIFDVEFSPHKYLVHLDRINVLSEGKDAPPVTLELDISSVCNHHCEWCVDPSGTHSGVFMSLQNVKNILNEAREMGIKGVVFKGGGESTLHPDFPIILKTTCEMDFEAGVVTHGGDIHSRNIPEAMVQYCAYVRVSIDGPTPKSRESIHGIDDFSNLINGIKRLMNLKKGKRHPIVGITFCLDYNRRSLIGNCIHLGEELGVDYILIRPPFCEEVGFKSPHTPEEADELRNLIRRTASQYEGSLNIMAGNWTGDKEFEHYSTETCQTDLARRDSGIRKSNYNGIEHITRRCPASPLFLVITTEGDVYGCCCLRGIREYSFGTIDYGNGISLSAIMRGERRKEVLKRMKNTECLGSCTHPLTKINELIEYLSLPEKFHSSFI